MKHVPVTSTIAAAALLAVCALVPLAAAGPASPTDPDKTSTAAGPALDSEYRLGPGDKLRIEVYKDPQLSQSLQIRPDGKITLPLIGDLESSGRTPIELRDVIASKLKEYITNPVVTVIVVEASAATAFVVGEVNHPGVVTLQGGQVTVLQALAMAGGLRDFANTKSIRILRKAVTGLQTVDFNYKDAMRGGTPIYLRAGDTVVVPD